MNKFLKLIESFQSNAYPAMVADLGNHLGLGSTSITRLAIGWAPIVPFKKKVSYQGWWAIPERNAEGETVGIALRSQNDDKTMFPGSKHGFVYEINPNHRKGDQGYSSGAHNWVRTMDAAVLCPVCGKPDGCLVSSEAPEDPQAVVCIREKSLKSLRFGFLHIRKEAGNLRSGSPLMESEGNEPVVTVEGFSDTAALIDMGLVGVGRPSNLACMDMLRDLVRTRPLLILGENDRKPDGREPGREGMIATFQTCKSACRDITMVMPPENVKDLRAWKNVHGLTKAQLLEYAEKHGQKKLDSTIILDDRPLTIARAFLDDKYRLASRYILRRWQETWYTYADAKYVPLKEEAFIQPLQLWAYDRLLQRADKKGNVTLEPLMCNNSLEANVMHAAFADTLIPSTQIPVWINGQTGPDPKNLIVFANGILNVPAFLDGDNDALLDPTPDLFTTAALPAAFDPTATCPSWLAFLQSSLGDDPDKVRLLQEWIGYCLTPDTTYQKMLYMRGPTASGKGRILEVLSALVGPEQTCNTSFSDLSGSFGLAPLVGKLICTIGDARAPRDGTAMRGLELLLNIVGDDGLQINRKHKDQLESHRLTARITIASNEILDVPDNAGALIRRLNLLEFKTSFAANPDYGLPERLKQEIPGIAVWALEGLRRLRQQGRFTIPTSSQEAIMDWRTATSPVAAFIEECTDKDEAGEVHKQELFDVWSGWSTERRITPVTVSRFYERVRTNATYVASDTYERGGSKHSVFRGLKLKRWAAAKFGGRPEGRQ